MAGRTAWRISASCCCRRRSFAVTGAWVLLEIGADQGAAVSQWIRDRLGADCCVLKDYAGLDRIARFQLSRQY